MADPTPLGVVPASEQTEVQSQLTADTRAFIDPNDGSNLIGYVVLAFYDDGSTLSSSFRPGTKTHKIGSTMFEAWARSSLEHQLANVIAVRAAERALKGEE